MEKKGKDEQEQNKAEDNDEKNKQELISIQSLVSRKGKWDHVGAKTRWKVIFHVGSLETAMAAAVI